MNETMKSVLDLGVLIIAVVGIAVSSILGIAILQGFTNTGLINETTSVGNVTTSTSYADVFILGIKVVGTFMEIIVLAIVGKTIIGMFRNPNN